MVLPKSSSIGDLDAEQLQVALGIDPDLLLSAEASPDSSGVDSQVPTEPVGANS